MLSELACTTERWLLMWAKIYCGFGLDPILSTTSLWANSGFKTSAKGVGAAVQPVLCRPSDGDFMKQSHPFRVILSEQIGSLTQQLELFALVNLGLVQSMASGVLTPTEAVERFYHARNCLYVQKHFRRKEAQIIMSRGVQLPDLFDCLPPEEAQRELYHELETMRSLCLKLLGKGRSRSSADHAAA